MWRGVDVNIRLPFLFEKKHVVFLPKLKHFMTSVPSPCLAWTRKALLCMRDGTSACDTKGYLLHQDLQ